MALAVIPDLACANSNRKLSIRDVLIASMSADRAVAEWTAAAENRIASWVGAPPRYALDRGPALC